MTHTPQVTNQADLQLRWSMLMGELGFGSPRLYMQFTSPDRSTDGVIVEVDELPDVPDAETSAGLLNASARLLAQMTPGTRVALLYARPGRGGLSAADRAWARSLTDAAVAADIPMWPVHVANDEALRVVAPDDLTESA